MRLAGGESPGPGLVLCCAASWKQSLDHGTCDPLAPDLHRQRRGRGTLRPFFLPAAAPGPLVFLAGHWQPTHPFWKM